MTESVTPNNKVGVHASSIDSPEMSMSIHIMLRKPRFLFCYLTIIASTFFGVLDSANADASAIINTTSSELENLGEAAIPEPEALDKAFTYYQQGQYAKVIATCGMILKTNPMSVDALNCRADGYRLLGKFDKALPDLKKALEINPNSAGTYNTRGIVYKDTGRFDKAIADFNRALTINPKHIPALLNLGNVVGARGNYNNAISYASRALEINPRHAGAHEFLGRAYLETGRNDEACVEFREACNLGMCRELERQKSFGFCQGSNIPTADVKKSKEARENR